MRGGQSKKGVAAMTTSKRPEQITFDFVRSPFFRVVHSNGAWGGITPHQELSVTFYSERLSLPHHITHELTPKGLGPEVSRAVKTNIQRECEVEVLMSMEEAVNLHTGSVIRSRSGERSV